MKKDLNDEESLQNMTTETEFKTMENMEILGGGLASGVLADRGVFGLEEYIRCKEENKNISARGRKRIGYALRLLELLERNFEKASSEEYNGYDVISRKLNSYLALRSLLIVDDVERREIIDNIKDKVSEMKLKIQDIISEKYVDLTEVKEIRDVLAKLGDIYLKSAFKALEIEKDNLWVAFG